MFCVLGVIDAVEIDDLQVFVGKKRKRCSAFFLETHS